MNRTLLGSFVAAALLLAIIWFENAHYVATIDEPQRLPIIVKQSISNASNTGQTESEESSNPVTSLPTSHVASQSAFHKRFASSTDFGATFREFAAIASTNPEALYFQAMASLVCQNFSGEALKTLEARAERESSTVVGKRRIEALTKFKTACANMPPDAKELRFLQAMQEAANRGDMKGRAVILGMNLPTNEADHKAAASIAESLAYTRDPTVFFNVGTYFEARERLANWHFPAFEGNISGAEMAAAFRLYACDLGDDCSAGSIDQLALCARIGRCDERDRNAEYQHDRLTPSQYDRVQRIRDIISQGIATRVWPAGFWTGVEKVPGTWASMKRPGYKSASTFPMSSQVDPN